MDAKICCPKDGCFITAGSPSHNYRFFTVFEKEKKQLNPFGGFIETIVKCNDCNTPTPKNKPHKITVYWYKLSTS